MLRSINKYLDKLEAQGLAKKNNAVFLALDAELYSSKPLSGDALELKQVFDLMNIGSLFLAEPSEPYNSIIGEILKYDNTCRELKKIVPMDCETRTFFHDIPVVDVLSPQAVAAALSRRKAAIIKGRGIVSYGAFTPEQAFVSYSSICFSTFVKYFYDSLVYFEKCAKEGIDVGAEYLKAFHSISNKIADAVPSQSPAILSSGPPENADKIMGMIAEAGKAVVIGRLVDSHFGNISYIHGGNIFITETGSSLDELEGFIDVVPMDGSSSVGITASSELSAHKSIYLQTGMNAIIHGHPKFSVIMSMYCKKEGCDRDLCHKACKEKREVLGIPVVPGEIGTGPSGLMHTVPAAIKDSGCAIVYGHGVFSAGKETFQGALDMLAGIEDKSRKEYFRTIKSLLQHLFDRDADCLAESK